MTIGPGTEFGQYTIVESIGAGGMGEVYRAHDAELERDVAIKVLPPSFSDDADRVARFEQEAKTLAALNHPNIAHIYGIARGDGATGLVMELIEGPTLADRIEQGPLPADEALGIAMQVAAALEAAHTRGIVHRDLKPANIKLREDGTVKVLDFGIAKAMASESTGVSSPIMTTPVTQIGVILGTAAYMSPEQARGKAVDQRTDIWAFGCLLYEMLTGQLAFSGEDVAVIMARVIANDTNMESLPKMISPAVRHTIGLCLQKDPSKRIADIRDVRLALAGAFEPEVASVVASEQAAVPFWRKPLPVGAAMLIIGVALALISAALLEPPPEPRPVNRFTYTRPAELQSQRQGENVMAVAPDGRHFVLNTTQGLYLRPLDQTEGRLIAGTNEDLHTPFFSPDGQQIGYWSAERARLMRIGISGGAPVAITDDIGGSLRGASWTANGTILLATARGIVSVPATGGTATVLIEPADGEVFQAPSLLPDGDTVLFALTNESWDSARIVAQSLSTGERTLLVEGGTTPRYVDTGHLIYFLDDGLLGVAFDAGSLTVSGGAVPLVQDVAQSILAVSGLANYDLADDGTLIYGIAGSEGAISINPIWVDPDGREELAGRIDCACALPAVSPDGSRIAFSRFDLIGGAQSVWILNANQQTFTPLTFDAGGRRHAVWAPDGEWIASGSDEGIFIQRADGTGSSEQVLETAANPVSWSAEGELIYVTIPTDGTSDIGVLSVDGEPMPGTVLSTPFNERRAELSPDGRWIAYESNESGDYEIYVRPYPEVDGGRWQISNGGGTEPHWSPDGGQLYFIGPETMMATTVVGAESFDFRTPEPLFGLGQYTVIDGMARRFDVSADGARLLMLSGLTPAGDFGDFVIVQNWTEELKRLVPVPD